MVKLVLKMSSANSSESLASVNADASSLKVARDAWSKELQSRPELTEPFLKDSVAIQDLVRKVCTSVHADIISALKALNDMREGERKRTVLQKLWSSRQLLLKLYVAMVWLRDSRAHTVKIKATVELLRSRVTGIGGVRDSLERLITGLQPTMLSNFDISTATDVLTLGTYERLPKAIENIGGVRPFSDDEEMSNFEKSLEPILLQRLMGNPLDPFPLDFKLLKMDGNKAFISIPKLFVFSLSLTTGQFHSGEPSEIGFELNWDDFQVLIKPAASLQRSKKVFSDGYKWHLVDHIRKKCLSKEQGPPLHQMSKYLKSVSDSLLLSILHMQFQIQRLGKVANFEPGQRLRLHMWKKTGFLRDGVEVEIKSNPELKKSSLSMLVKFSSSSAMMQDWFPRHVSAVDKGWLDFSHHLANIDSEAISIGQIIAPLFAEIKLTVYNSLVNHIPSFSSDICISASGLEWHVCGSSHLTISIDSATGGFKFISQNLEVDPVTTLGPWLGATDDRLSNLDSSFVNFWTLLVFRRFESLAKYNLGLDFQETFVPASSTPKHLTISLFPLDSESRIALQIARMDSSLEFQFYGRLGGTSHLLPVVLKPKQLPTLELLIEACQLCIQTCVTRDPEFKILLDNYFSDNALSLQDRIEIDCRFGSVFKGENLINVDFSVIGSEMGPNLLGRISMRFALIDCNNCRLYFLVPIINSQISRPYHLPQGFTIMKGYSGWILCYEMQGSARSETRAFLEFHRELGRNFQMNHKFAKSSMVRNHLFAKSFNFGDDYVAFSAFHRGQRSVPFMGSSMLTFSHTNNPLALSLLSGFLLLPECSLPEMNNFVKIGKLIIEHLIGSSPKQIKLVSFRSPRHFRVRFMGGFSLDFISFSPASSSLNNYSLSSSSSSSKSPVSPPYKAFSHDGDDDKDNRMDYIYVFDISRRMRSSSSGPVLVSFPNFPLLLEKIKALGTALPAGLIIPTDKLGLLLQHIKHHIVVVAAA